MVNTILGRKLGMTQIWDENDNVVPVTVVQAGPCVVSQVKTKATDGYDAPEIPGCVPLSGFALFREDLDSAVAAGDLMGVLTPGGRTRVLLLGDATAAGLRQFLQLLNHDEGHALTLTESDLP